MFGIFACKSSPYFNYDNVDERIMLSLTQVYQGQAPMRLINKYKGGNFARGMQTAIEEVSKFEPGARIRGKMMVDKMLTNLEQLININASDDSQFLNKDNEIDWSKKKSYIDSVKTTVSILPELISAAEKGFDVSEIKESIEGATGKAFIDEFHNEQ